MSCLVSVRDMSIPTPNDLLLIAVPQLSPSALANAAKTLLDEIKKLPEDLQVSYRLEVKQNAKKKEEWFMRMRVDILTWFDINIKQQSEDTLPSFIDLAERYAVQFLEEYADDYNPNDP